MLNKFVFGIKNQQAQEKLLLNANPMLVDTDEIGCSHEITAVQMKVKEEVNGVANVVNFGQDQLKPKSAHNQRGLRKCQNRGRKHELGLGRHELFPEYGKTCTPYQP